MEQRRAEGTEIRQRAEERREDQNLRGVALVHALRRAAEREAVLVVRDSAPEVEHTNLARVLEASPELRFALVEDLRDTHTVAELVCTRGPAHWQEAVELGRHLARALAALHDAGFVHADLALSSVHVNAHWEPVLSRSLEPGAPNRNLRELGAILYALLTAGLPASPPVDPTAFAPEAPARLARLVLELLEGRVERAAQAALLLDGFRA
jgi:hypothetical protein